MRTLFVICTLTLSVIATAHAGVRATEGRLQTAAPPEPDSGRVARYSGAPAASGAFDDSKVTANTEKKHAAAAMKLEPKRAPSVALSQKSSWFELYDAGHTLRRDRDGDGYHSEFQIRFDADVAVDDALVYAKLYVRRVGDTGYWQHYYTTDDFWIYGQSGTDDYYVTTTLDDGFATGDYDVLIDLYESGYSGIVATLTAYDDPSLGYLPLEETSLDVPYGLPGYSIRGVSTTLLIDDDRDDFYSRFRINFDPDTDFGSTLVYAIVWVRSQGGEWIKEHESDDFIVDSSGTADAYSFTADWINGYPTALYDVQLDLYDSATGLLVASAGSERAEFSRLPLEDAARDRFVSAPANVSSVTITTSSEHGGGAVSTWLVLALLGVLVARAISSRQSSRRYVLSRIAERRATKEQR